MTTTPGARIVAAINWTIGALLICALALVYWFAWRPLPQRSGNIRTQVSQPVTVRFDKLGEPHIRAATEEDALFVQGYVTAQDRLWQMEGLRRLAAGDLAEIIGARGLENDQEARRLLMRRSAEADYLNLPPRDRAALAAYTRGVNAFLATHLHDLPVEFTLLNYQPRPWSVVDSILVSLQMFRTLTPSWRQDLRKRDMLRNGDPQKVAALFATRSGSEVQPGSNAWALAGNLTASGKPELSNDMHLEYGLPGIWYMTHLEAPGLNVAGVALPGLPGIIVGHNQHIAWGITNLQFDVQDLYIEKLDERTGRYLYRGQVQQARPDLELIPVKGQAATELLVWITHDGPLFVTEGGDRMALRWVAHDASIYQYPVLEYDRAQNWQQFTTALARFAGPGSNFVYADADGNIGYHAAGRFPVRHGYAGDVPVDGASGDFEWQGYIPFDQLPATFNPPRGIIASANQNPFPRDYAYAVNGVFAPPDRAHEILEALSARKGWRPEQSLAVQKDVYSEWFHFLAAEVVAAYEGRQIHTAQLDQATALLRGWNGQMEKNLAAPFLMELIYLHLRSAVADSAAPGSGATYDFPFAPAVLEHLLRAKPRGWFSDYDELLLRALADGVEEGVRIQGRDLKRWQYGSYLRITIDNPIVHQVPWVGKYFDIGPAPLSGSNTTIKQTTPRLGPSMRMDADTGDWDGSLLNVLTGQSGQILSSHYRDQWEAYYTGRSFPMQFQNVKTDSTLEFQPAAR
jgi:penicillin G amidase